jgi:hypothetical protein
VANFAALFGHFAGGNEEKCVYGLFLKLIIFKCNEYKIVKICFDSKNGSSK